MRPKSILLLGLALGCGLVASIGISQVMEQRRTVETVLPETEAILVALKDINLAEPITADVLKLEEWPKDKITPDALRNLDEVVGRRTRTKIYAGEPLREAKLISADGGDAPSEQIAKGYRVVAVRVDAATGVAGLVKPGDRVDVQLFVSKNDRNGISQSVVKTILEDVRIFAVDSSFRRAAEESEDASPAAARTISLLVTPKQAETLNLANELGKIRLTIRHPDDDTDVAVTGTTTEDLFVSSKAQRDQESASATSETNDDLRQLLDQLKQQPGAAPESREVAALPTPPPFIMQVFEGNAAREFEFTGDGRLPQAAAMPAPSLKTPDVTGIGPGPAAAGPTLNPAPPEGHDELQELSGKLDQLDLAP